MDELSSARPVLGSCRFLRSIIVFALHSVLAVLFGTLFSLSALAQQPIRLANEPALSPDGATLAFAWRGEIWTVPVSGGNARQLTKSAAADGEPFFSPDG